MNTVNFLREQQNNVLDEFIQWMLTYGRAVVMFTYFVALLAFLYRFSIDYQISNLHDSIKNDAALIQRDAPLEHDYRNMQERLKVISAVDQQSMVIVTRFKEIISKANGNVTFTNVSISNNTVNATVTTNSIQGLNSFVNDMKDLPYVTSVNIDSIQNKLSTNQIVASVGVNMDATN